MAHDKSKVPLEHADLFYHGVPDEDGNPVGLSDDEYDRQKQEYRDNPDLAWPFDEGNTK